MTAGFRACWSVASGLVLALILCAPPAVAETGQPPPTRTPPRDAPAAPKKGTSVLRGRVVAADTGKPLRRARITLVGEGQGQDGSRTTSTNLDGRYEFKELPAGRYRASVQRGGYLPLDYGQRRPGELGRPVELGEGETLDKVDFALPRMGLITGRVTDESGEPIEGVTVYPMRSMFFEGRRRLVPVSQRAQTDDAGEYRITRLAPGTYFVMASTKETWTVTQQGTETMFGYLPTYYPGVGQQSDARGVRVGIGQEVSGTDLALVPGRAAKITGIALDSQGRPFPRVSLGEEVRGLNFASFSAGLTASVTGDGTFTFLNVAPGTYTLQATRTDNEPEVALMQVTVDGSDLENIVLTGSSGGAMSGRVISESGELPRTGVSVLLVEGYRAQASPAVIGTFRNQRPPEVKEDGLFTATNVFGRTRFRVNLPDGWMLKQITHAGRDITDEALELRSGETLAGVEVLITNRLTSLGGQVVDTRETPVGDATVLVFPSAREKWYESSRSVRAARPDQQGKWQFKALPADDYLVLALEYVEDGAWNDPEYLESLREQAQSVTLPESGTLQVSLKLQGSR